MPTSPIQSPPQPSEASLLALVGCPLAEAWQELVRFMADHYELPLAGRYTRSKDSWAFPYKKGSRPLCELEPESGSFTVLVVLGKDEASQVSARLDEFGPNVQAVFKNARTFHDGKWMWIRVADSSTCQQDARDNEQLVIIKKKPSRPV